MKWSFGIALASLALLTTPAHAADTALQRAERVLAAHPVVDGHNDLAWEIRDGFGGHVEAVDLEQDSARFAHPLQTDWPRARKGHLGGQFWSVWIPTTVTGPAAVEMTLEQIDIVKRLIARWPNEFQAARTADDVHAAIKAHRIASLIGVEGGHQIDSNLAVLRMYRDLGVSYMTLTHGKNTPWADSATDDPHAHGLTDFGRAVVHEMNRIGMMVDLAHVSAETMRAAIAVSKAPVIFSHSSARAVDDHPRNVPDDVLRLLPANGGVVMVNVYPAFVSEAWRKWDADRAAEQARLSAGPAGLALGDPDRAKAMLAAWDKAHPEPLVTVAQVADHVEHIAKIAGHDHVGIGGDYDGIDGTGPKGMKGVDGYPLLFAELARRGWSDADLAKLADGNILRVMDRVAAVSRAMRNEPPGEARG